MFYISTLILLIFLVSCNNETGSQSASSAISTGSINSKTGLPYPNNTAQIGLNPEHGKPGHRCDIAVGAPLPGPAAINTASQENLDTSIAPDNELIKPVTATTTNVATGMNPQHGQPGHRCDIAVGAPLNSPVKNTTTQASTVTNVPANNTEIKPSTTAVTKVAPGMNPQHGQPGHRCDIAVGSPLADTAKNKTSLVNTSQTTANIPITNTSANVPTNFVEKPAETTVTTVVPGMNPKHGEPGHRCDIAVGAPLNSKPKQ